MLKRKKYFIFLICISFLIFNNIKLVYAKENILIKNKTIFLNQDFYIKLNNNLNIDSIKKSNKNISIKKIKRNKYLITPHKLGKSNVIIKTNKKEYKYQINIKKTYKLDNDKLKKIIKEQNPKKIIFTNKKNKKYTFDLSSNNDKSVISWINKDTMYISTNDNNYIISDDLSYMFFDCKNIELIDFTYLKTSNNDSTLYMFANCENLNTIINLNKYE